MATILYYVTISIYANRSWGTRSDQDANAFTTLREYLTQVRHVKIRVVYCRILHLSTQVQSDL